MKRLESINGTEEDVSSSKRTRQCEAEAAAALFEKQILTNPLITDTVFADVPFSDLLNFSLVSKAWNLTCRGILVDRFRTYLTLSEKSTVEELEEFYNLILDAVPGHQHPVNGLRINFNTRTQDWPFSSEPFADLISRIMGEMQVKCVSFDMKKLDLELFEFYDIFKTLVVPHLGTIEFLEILNLNGTLRTFSNHLKVGSLPNLRELNFGDSRPRLRRSTFKRILRACPNVKKFPAVLPYQLPILGHTNRLDLASKVRFNYMQLNEHTFPLLQNYGSRIKILQINQHYKFDRNEYEGDYISRLLPLFSSCFQHTLVCLQIDLDPLVAILLQKEVPPLPNVKELNVSGDIAWSPCLIKNKEIRFADFLPNLKSIVLNGTGRSSSWLKSKYGAPNYYYNLPVALIQAPVPVSLDSVTTLKLRGLVYKENEVGIKIVDLDQVFPSVTNLDIEIDIGDLEQLLKWICESWGDVLEVLKIRVIECMGFYNKCLPTRRIPDHELEEIYVSWRNLKECKRKPLPAGVLHSDKLTNLRRLELEFRHPKQRDCTGNYVEEKVKVHDHAFEPRSGHKVQLIVSGCRALKRKKRVKSGVSVYDTILALHSCPRNLELSLAEKIIANKAICKNICKMLPTKYLLRYSSYVNKSWNAAAREVLYEDRCCILPILPMYFGSTKALTQIFGAKQNLYNALVLKPWTSDLTFSGFVEAAEAATQFLENFEVNRKRFRLMQVSGLDGGYPAWKEYSEVDVMRVQAVKLFKTLFSKLDLDHVQVLMAPIQNFDELFRDKEGKLLVPNLKRIQFVDPEKCSEHSGVFQHLLNDLKFLEKILVPLSNKLLSLVASAGRAHCVKHILYNVGENEVLLDESILSLKSVRELNFPNPKYTVLDLEDSRTSLGALLKFAQEQRPLVETITVGNLRGFNKWNEPFLGRIFKLLCTSSYESLQSLDLSLPTLQIISKVYTRPLVTVQRIELTFDRTDSDGLLRIPFAQLAPNLEAVELTRNLKFSIEHPSEDDYNSSLSDSEEEHSGASSTLQQQLQTCTSVKSLTLKVSYSEEEDDDGLFPSSSPEIWSVDCLARVFSRVTHFSFYGTDSSDFETGNVFPKLLGSPWKGWPESLESVEMEIEEEMDAVTFESWVLGISEEEWDVWKAVLDDESGSKVDELNSEDDDLTSEVDELTSQDDELTPEGKQLTSKDDELTSKEDELTSKDDELTPKEDELTSKYDELTSKEDELTSKDDELTSKEDELTSKDDEWASEDDESTSEINKFLSGIDLVDRMHYAPSSFSFRDCKNLKELLINNSIKTLVLGRLSHDTLSWDKVCLKTIKSTNNEGGRGGWWSRRRVVENPGNLSMQSA